MTISIYQKNWAKIEKKNQERDQRRFFPFSPYKFLLINLLHYLKTAIVKLYYC
jgi:hypothetical protein